MTKLVFHDYTKSKASTDVLYVAKWCEFAAAALSGLNAFSHPDNTAIGDLDCVDRAAEQADAMLAELKKRLSPGD